MKHLFHIQSIAYLVVAVSCAVELHALQVKPAKVKTPKDRVVEFCRAESLARLKYTKTIEWLDTAKQETGDTWLVSGIRTAKAPAEEVDQQFTCRVQITNNKQRLRMIQIFKESSKTGKDVFEVR